MIGWAALACATPAEPGPTAPSIFQAESPSQTEDYCAWYGDAHDDVLYFGQAAFWSAFRRAGGEPMADLAHPGPQRIGRFDLARHEFMPALEVTSDGARSGVWDVLARPGGWVYYTTYFEPMGRVHVESGEVERFADLGSGLNEIAPGPDGNLLISRYAGEGGSSGSVVVVSPEGQLLAEHALPQQAGQKVLAKTVAFDAARREIWVTTDGVFDDGRPTSHDAFVLGEDGSLRRTISEVEVQFVAFADESRWSNGPGARVEAAGETLTLVMMDSERREYSVVLDEVFAQGLDFAQDIQIEQGRDLIVTTWSGNVYRTPFISRAPVTRMPAVEPGGLYYTAVAGARPGQVCATYCGGVRVVCR